MPDNNGTHLAPYAVDGRYNQFGVAPSMAPDPANYSPGATPRNDGNQLYVTAPGGIGYAPHLTTNDYEGVSDPTRTEVLPRTDRRANLRNPFGWWRRYDADTRERESVTVQQATGFTEQKRVKTRAPHPLWTPPPEPRPTTALNPHRYYFERPFGQHTARTFDGRHMSLADNRRAYPILTMTPVTARRNTYRAEPSPWDTDIVDESGDTTAWRPDARLAPVDMPAQISGGGGRSYRSM